MRRALVILAALLLSSAAAAAQEVGAVLSGPVEVTGGDGVRLRGYDLRLYGIIALAGHDAAGDAAAAKLRAVIGGRPLTCQVMAAAGGRRDALCKVGGVQGSDIAAIMVDAGWASTIGSRCLRQLRPELIKTYVRLEVEARAACLGLWRTRPPCR